MEYFFLTGTTFRLDGGAMFGHVPRELWSRWTEPDLQNRILLAGRSLVVKVDGRVLLFEAGTGAYMEPKYAEQYGIEQKSGGLTGQLKRRGIEAGEVTDVVLSHLHFDHAGGLVPDWPAVENSGWKVRFENARYWVGAVQFERARAPHVRDRASFIPGLCEKLEETGRLSLVSPGGPSPPELAALLDFSFSDGHTPGMMHALIRTDASPLFFAADLVPGTAWLHLPVTMGYDRNPEQLIEEKNTVLRRAAEENWRLVYTHDPVVASSSIRYNGGKKRFEAFDRQEAL